MYESPQILQNSIAIDKRQYLVLFISENQRKLILWSLVVRKKGLLLKYGLFQTKTFQDIYLIIRVKKSL